MRESDLVARIRHNSFVILFDSLNDAAPLQERALSVHASITRPLRLGASTASLDVHIGGAISPRHGPSEQAVLAAADLAMGRARQSGEGYRLAGDA